MCEDVCVRGVFSVGGGGADVFISCGSGFGRDEGVGLGGSGCEDVRVEGVFWRG